MRTQANGTATMRCGLSLIEVLVAVAICAGAVVAVIALFGPTVRATRETAERRTVVRLAERLDGELRRGGLASLPSGGTFELVATADGARLVLRSDADNDPANGSPAGIPAAERDFLLSVSPEPDVDAGTACRVLRVRVSWPLALPPEGTEVPAAQRSDWWFHTAVNR